MPTKTNQRTAPGVEVRLLREGNDPAANEVVTLLEPSGVPAARLETDEDGRVLLPTNGSPEITFRVGTSGSETFRVPAAADTSTRAATVRLPASPRAMVRLYGQVVDRKGQPAPGVGITIHRDDVAEPLANTVTDSNGGFALSIPADPDTQRKYEVRLSVRKEPLPLEGLGTLRKKVVGPLTIVVDHAPTRTGVAPKLQLLMEEDDLVEAFKNARQLFSRPVAARTPDACSPASPAEIPARVFYLQQLVMFPTAPQRDEFPMGRRGPANFLRARNDVTGPIDFETVPDALAGHQLRYGAAMEFRQEWWDFGYTLGDLLYSVPLAPCEETKIATVDWRRRDYAKSQTALDESVFQDTTISRDEAINEAVRMISDKQVQGSTEGGGLGATLGFVSGGWAKSVTSIDEATDASTSASRFINDRIQQVSNTLRNTRSFAIVETTEEEESTVRTRVLRNHNHSHTLTFQYFQVMRNFLLRTKLNALRPTVFVPFQLLDFTPELVLRHAYVLRRALLDPTLERAFDKVLGLVEAAPGPTAPTDLLDPNAPKPEGDAVELRLSAVVTSEPEDVRNPGFERNWWEVTSLVVNDDDIPFTAAGIEYSETELKRARVAPKGKLALGDIRKLGLQATTSNFVYTFDGFTIEANVGTHDQPAWRELYFVPTVELHPGRRHVQEIRRGDAAAPATRGPRETADPDLARLVAHLNGNRAYYTGAVIAGGDAGLRYLALSQFTDVGGNVLADIVENTVAGFAGNYVGFPLRGLEFLPEAYYGTKTSWLDDPPQERIITLPTPGVFAESQLGSCNASEKIDNTRFWDWQQSPCPDDAPDITEGMLASRFQDLKGLLEVVKSDLKAPDVQIPTEPEPMIKIGDATLAELVKGLNLSDMKDVQDLVKGFVDSSVEGFGKMVDAVSEARKAAQPGGGMTGDVGDLAGLAGGAAGGAAGEAGAGAATDAGLAETAGILLV